MDLLAQPTLRTNAEAVADDDMNDPDRLTSHNDKIFDPHTRALILRIIVVACLGMLFWQAIIAAGSL
jgi:hypothetical protein